MSGWNVGGGGGGGIQDAMRSDGMAVGGISGCGGRPGGMAAGRIPDAGASGWNVGGGEFLDA